MKDHKRSAAWLLLYGLLLHAALAPAAAAATKWVVFVYMLADNDLEQFGLMDMEVSSLNINQVEVLQLAACTACLRPCHNVAYRMASTLLC
jgi:hypothetical protein